MNYFNTSVASLKPGNGNVALQSGITVVRRIFAPGLNLKTDSGIRTLIVCDSIGLIQSAG